MSGIDFSETMSFLVAVLLAVLVAWVTKCSGAEFFIIYLLFRLMGRTRKLK